MADLIKRIATYLLRYSLGLILIWLGFLKFKNFEALYLQNLVETSYLYWIFKIASPFVWSQIFGYVQIFAGISIMAQPVSKRLSLYGGIVALLMYCISISFLFSTSEVWQTGYGFPEMSKAGQSIFKDLVLASATLWCIGDSLSRNFKNSEL